MHISDHRHSMIIRKIAALLVCLVFLNTTPFIGEVYALSPWAGTETTSMRLTSLRHYLEKKSQVIIAREDDQIKLLIANGDPDGLLLTYGKYLISEKAEQDDLRFVRAVIHEDIEALMQVLAKHNRYRYRGIKEIVLREFPLDESNLEKYYPLVDYTEFSTDLYVNHIIAKVFEWITLTEREIISEDEIPAPYSKLVSTLKYIIMRRKHNYFKSDFWNLGEREEKIISAINEKSMEFYQVGDLESTDTKDEKISKHSDNNWPERLVSLRQWATSFDETDDRAEFLLRLEKQFSSEVGVLKKEAEKREYAKVLINNIDFTRKSEARACLNIAILNVAKELNPEHMDEQMLVKAATFLDYNGEFKDEVRKAGRDFFQAIPKKSVFDYSRVYRSEEKTKDISDHLESYLRQINEIPLLTRVGEIKMGVLTQLGDENAEKTLHECNLRLVWHVVKNNFMSKTRIHVMDLISAGNGFSKRNLDVKGINKSGLANAAKVYEPQRGIRFSTFAGRAIKNSIKGEIAQFENSVSYPNSLRQQINEFISDCADHGINPKDDSVSDETIVNTLSVKKDRVRRLRTAMKQGGDSLNHDDPRRKAADGPRKYGEAVGENDPELMKETYYEMVDHIVERVEARIHLRFDGKAEKYIKLFRIIVKPMLLLKPADEIPGQLEVGAMIGYKDPRIGQVMANQMLVGVLKKDGKRRRGIWDMVRDVIIGEMGLEPEDFFGHDRAADKEIKIKRGAPADALQVIYDKFRFDEFKRSELLKLRDYHPSTVDMELKMLRELNILIRVKRGWYRLSPSLKFSDEGDDEKTANNIASIYNIELKTSPRGNKKPLDRYSIPEGKIPVVRERVKLEVMHQNFKELRLRDKDIINVWSGYAKSSDQKNILQEIRKIAPKNGYEINFGNISDEEKSVKELVNLAIEKKDENDSIVTVLPFTHPYVQKKLKELKNAHVIFMDYDSDKATLDSFFHIEGIIAAASAYLNNNDRAFMNLYTLLTDKECPAVTVSELRKNPELLKFNLKPITAKDPSDLEHLNERMLELLHAV